MNILVIEDDEFKFKQIEKTLNKLLKGLNIVWMNSRNSGLFSFIMKNKQTKNNPYHIVITDNYLPLNEKMDVEPFAKEIVDEIRRLGFSKLPIIICSSEDIEECDFNYKIKYDSSISLDKTFENIFKKILSSGISLEEMVEEDEKKLKKHIKL